MRDEIDDLPKLPSGWIWTKLGEVASDPQYGWTTSAVADGKLHLLRTTDITPGHVDWTSVPFCKDEPPDIGKYLLHDGDIVISRAGSVGYSHLVKNPPKSVFASYLIRFQPLINHQYFAMFLTSPSYWESISDKSIGIALANVNASKLKQILMPLPPLLEQHRIVAKIEELITRLDAGVEALKKIKAQLKRYRQSVLKHAFEGKLTEEWRQAHKDELEPASVLLDRIKQERQKSAKGKYKELSPLDTSDLPDLPERWVWTRLGEIALEPQYGWTTSAVDTGKLRLLRTTDITSGHVDWTSVPFCQNEPPYVAKYLLHDGDIVISRAGSVGYSYLVKNPPEAVFASYLIRFKPLIDVAYFDLFLKSPMYWEAILEKSIGIALANVNASKLKQISMPLPPLPEQRRIVEEIDHCFSVADQIEKTIDQSFKQAERLRQSILKRAFEGKLVPQDLNDEPAGKLLERIKEELAKRLAEDHSRKKNRTRVTTKQTRLV